jgi:ribosomal 50S subunit-associated protein YjgA (DUF615 family)
VGTLREEILDLLSESKNASAELGRLWEEEEALVRRVSRSSTTAERAALQTEIQRINALSKAAFKRTCQLAAQLAESLEKAARVGLE